MINKLTEDSRLAQLQVRRTFNPVVVSRSGVHIVSFELLQSLFICISKQEWKLCQSSRLAQLVERRTFNPVVAGSSPAVGDLYFYCSGYRFSLLKHHRDAILICCNEPFWIITMTWPCTISTLIYLLRAGSACRRPLTGQGARMEVREVALARQNGEWIRIVRCKTTAAGRPVQCHSNM